MVAPIAIGGGYGRLKIYVEECRLSRDGGPDSYRGWIRKIKIYVEECRLSRDGGIGRHARLKIL